MTGINIRYKLGGEVSIIGERTYCVEDWQGRRMRLLFCYHVHPRAATIQVVPPCLDTFAIPMQLRLYIIVLQELRNLRTYREISAQAAGDECALRLLGRTTLNSTVLESVHHDTIQYRLPVRLA